MTSKLILVAATSVFTACAVEKKEPAPVVDTPAPAVVTPTPAPAVIVDSPVVVAPPSSKPKTKSGPASVGGERDSAVQPVLGIGADGKVRPVKK